MHFHPGSFAALTHVCPRGRKTYQPRSQRLRSPRVAHLPPCSWDEEVVATALMTLRSPLASFQQPQVSPQPVCSMIRPAVHLQGQERKEGGRGGGREGGVVHTRSAW